jgi:hypothetical protein
MTLTVDAADLLPGATLKLLLGRRADGADIWNILFRPAGLADLRTKNRRLVQAANNALGEVRLAAADTAQFAQRGQLGGDGGGVSQDIPSGAQNSQSGKIHPPRSTGPHTLQMAMSPKCPLASLSAAKRSS